jgi:hypothetical protein
VLRHSAGGDAGIYSQSWAQCQQRPTVWNCGKHCSYLCRDLLALSSSFFNTADYSALATLDMYVCVRQASSRGKEAKELREGLD